MGVTLEYYCTFDCALEFGPSQKEKTDVQIPVW